MIHLFTKKYFLVDYLKGFVDIHNHILPGIDDGAQNVAESIRLLKGMQEFGVGHFICTPHIMHNYHDNDRQSISKAHSRLTKALADTSKAPKVSFAAEHMIDDNFEALLSKNEVLPLGQKHVLIEMSYLQPSINFDDAVLQLLQKQYTPVLAHPERYLYYHKTPAIYQTIKNKGVALQLNMLSLQGYYGKDIQKIAYYLLDHNLIDFLGSDLHHSRHLETLKKIVIPKKYVDKLSEIITNNIVHFI